MLTLNDISKKHTEWLKIARYLGADLETAKEIVQQMYLKIGEMEIKENGLKRLINYNGGINTVYIFKVIQNQYYDLNKKKEFPTEIECDFEIHDCTEEEIKYNQLLNKLRVTIDNLSEYEQILLELYFSKKCSLRDIHKSTGIGVHSIFNTIKNAKEKIKHQTSGEYREYSTERDNRTTRIRFGRYNPEGNQSDWD